MERMYVVLKYNIGEEMENRIIAIINEITAGQYSEEELRSKDFDETKMIDSLQIVELVMALENEFEIEIEDEDLGIDNLKSFRAIVALVKRLKVLN